MKMPQFSARRRSIERPIAKQSRRKAYRPTTEPLEGRLVLSYAGGTGAVVVGLSEPLGGARTAIVAEFDGPLDPISAQDVANYRVNAVAPGDPRLITTTGASVAIVSTQYDPATLRVTLTLAQPLDLNRFYRVKISGDPTTGVMDLLATTDGNGATTFQNQPIDGDADDTPAGDFYGLVGAGDFFRFADSNGDTASIRLSRGGSLQIWRQLNGDVNVMAVVGGTDRSVLHGHVRRSRGGDGQVVLPSTPGFQGVINRLSPRGFPIQATTPLSPVPVVATRRNLPYSLRIEAVSMPSVPSVQSAVSAQSGGKWLIFGGRTNGLHSFDPTGVASFPPLFQNNNVSVIDPATGQTWTRSWADLGLPESTWTSLASTNQEHYQDGDRLYAIGGYSSTTTVSGGNVTINYRTHDTLSSISVSGLIDAVIGGGSAVGSVRQIRDPRFAVTGGDLGTIGDRTYLVFGQTFQGGYDGNTGTAEAGGSQIYTDEIRSFRIIDDGQGLAIADYQALRDPVNFRRRDGNLAQVSLPDGQPGLAYLGGVFTVPAGGGYLNPVVISGDGSARVESYQQYFSQYTSPLVSLYDSKRRTTDTILFGGISLYDYSFTTGSLIQDTELPFVDDVTSLVRRPDGSSQEYIMPSQLPGLYGAAASYLAAPGLPTTPQGLVRLRNLRGPTTLGYIYGGIFSTVPNTTNPRTQTTASSQVFRITLVPNGA